MNACPTSIAPNACSQLCSTGISIETLNRDCFCIAVDQKALRAEIDADLGAHSMSETLADSHPHLFSALPVYVPHRHIQQIAKVVAAIEQVAASPAYRLAVLSWAPEIAKFDPGSPGGLLGLDFHLGLNGPQLIEINTNPGGVLLNALLGHAQRACMPELTVTPTDTRQVEETVLEAMLMEWNLQRGQMPLRFVAIVDEDPERQYLYPEFLLFRELFRRHGYIAEICSPELLVRQQDSLWLGEHRVDFLYNRLTDFALQQPAHAVLRETYLDRTVVLSPHPRAHALYADKRNLSLLGNRDFLHASGASDATIAVLVEAIPRTQLVTAKNRDAMWANRRRLFFKPAAGFGSKASYRGDKLTHRVWDEIAGGTYIAQDIVPPSERYQSSDSDPLKVDIRCYSYRGEALLYAARMYRGQTTNFRTPGGGFAPVLTSKETPAPAQT